MVKNYLHIAGFGVMLVDTPSPENRVMLGSDGEPQIQYVLSEPDKLRFRRGVSEAIRLMFLAGAKQVMLPTTENVLSDKPETELNPLILTDAKQADRGGEAAAVYAEPNHCDISAFAGDEQDWERGDERLSRDWGSRLCMWWM